ncbi:MAG: ABC transporter substrate-binding protein [Acidobacteriota bacterium]
MSRFHPFRSTIRSVQRPVGTAWRAVAVVAVAGLALGCPSKDARIGVVLPLSGQDQAIGESIRRGIELGAEQLAANGSTVAFMLEFADSQSDPETARAELDRLIDQGVVATIGGATEAEARVVVPVAEDRERVLIMPSTGDQRLSHSARFAYRIAPSYKAAGSTLANFATTDLKIESAVVLAQDTTFADTAEEGFRPIFEAQERQIFDRLEAPSTNGDLTAAVATIGETAPGAVLLAGDGPWLTSAVQRLREADYGGRIMALPTFAHPGTLDALGTDASSVLFAHPPFDLTSGNEALTAFSEAYQAKYGEAPDVHAAQGYDALWVYATALEGRPPMAGEVRRWIRDHVKNVDGLTATLQFDEDSGLTAFPRVYSVNDDGALYDYQEWLDAEREARKERLRKLKEERDRLLAEQAALANGG